MLEEWDVPFLRRKEEERVRGVFALQIGRAKLEVADMVEVEKPARIRV